MRVYKLKNGCRLAKRAFYNGYVNVVKWCIFEPGGRLYMSFDSYEKAYEMASRLKFIECN